MSAESTGLPPLEISTEDDPAVVAEAATDDYSLHVVPMSWRLPKVSVLLAFSSMATAVFWLYLAALVALLVGTREALIGMGLVVILYSAIGHLFYRAASETGLNITMFSRSMLGFLGSALTPLVAGATGIYYFVFEASIVAVGAKAFFDRQGVGIDLDVWYLIVVLISVPLVIKGVHVWLDRLNGWLLPLYLGGLIAVLIWTTSNAGGYSGDWGSFAPAELLVQGPGWLFAFSTYMSVFVLFMYQMGYARLGRPKDVRFASLVTFGPVFYLVTFVVNAIIGIYLVNILHLENLAEGELATSIVGVTGLVGLLWLVVTQSRINTANLYLASTGLQSFAARILRLNISRPIWVVIAGAIGYLIMLTNVFSFILDALTYQGIAIVAWVGMAIVQILFLLWQRGSLSSLEYRPGRLPAVNPAGLGIWIAATALGVILKNVEEAFFGTWGLPLVLVVSVVLYALALAVAPRRWFGFARPYDPAQEVDDSWEERVRCHVCERSYVAREMDRDPSAGHLAICASCAEGIGFLKAAAHEAHQVPSEPRVRAKEPV